MLLEVLAPIFRQHPDLKLNGIMHHFKGILTQWSEYVGP